MDRLPAPSDPPPDLLGRLGEHFTRAEPRRQAVAYIQALRSAPQRGNAAEIAQGAGFDSVWSIQRLLTRAVWDADALRDTVRSHLTSLLGGAGSCAVLSRHQTGRTGLGAVAAAPQPGDGGGRERNSQVAALLCYVTGHGGALVDRELYVPAEWTADPQRCARAGVPPERSRPRTMAELGKDMLERIVAAAVPVGWVVGGPDYADATLYHWLCRRRLPFCLQMSGPAGPMGPPQIPAATRFTALPQQETWLVSRHGLEAAFGRPAEGFRFALLLRRASSGDTMFLIHAPTAMPDGAMPRPVAAAATAGQVLRLADQDAGLGSHRVRSWVAWYRHTTLAMAAAALRVDAEFSTRTA